MKVLICDDQAIIRARHGTTAQAGEGHRGGGQGVQRV